MAEILSQKSVGYKVEGLEYPSSENKDLTHIISDAADATARYSASVEDLATDFYFLEDQEIGTEPIYNINPVVENLSEGSPAQSASENA